MFDDLLLADFRSFGEPLQELLSLHPVDRPRQEMRETNELTERKSNPL
jgi:hypothetical protein